MHECQNLPDSKVVVEDSGAKAEEAGSWVGDEENNAARSAQGKVATDSSAPSINSLARFSRFLSLLVASAQAEQTPSTTERERIALAELLQARRVGRAHLMYDCNSFFRETAGVLGDSSLPCLCAHHSVNAVLSTTKPNIASDDGSDVGNFDFGFLDPYGSSTTDEETEKDREDNERLHPSPPQRRPSPSTSPEPSPVLVRSPGSPRPVRYWARRIHRFLLSVRELRAVPDRDLGSLDQIMHRLF